MRTATFEVPADLMEEFTDKLTELELENSITGKNEDDEIVIEVYYEKNEASNVDKLEEFTDEIKDEYYSDEEDDEDEDDD